MTTILSLSLEKEATSGSKCAMFSETINSKELNLIDYKVREGVRGVVMTMQLMNETNIRARLGEHHSTLRNNSLRPVCVLWTTSLAEISRPGAW